jgi:hypothetical protein
LVTVSLSPPQPLWVPSCTTLVKGSGTVCSGGLRDGNEAATPENSTLALRGCVQTGLPMNLEKARKEGLAGSRLKLTGLLLS